MPPPTADDLKYRARLSQRLAAILFGMVVIATVVRPLIATLSPWLTTAGICNALLLLAIYSMISSGRLLERAPATVCYGSSAMLLMLFAMTGGADSQFAVVVPIVPIMAVMLGGAPLCIGNAALWSSVAIIDLFLPGGAGAAQTIVDSIEDSRARSFWLLLSIATSSVFALYVDRSLVQLKTKLQRQATIDPLTGLLNRRGLQDSVGWELARAARTQEPLAVLMADIDHFKQLNDQHGHKVGDQALELIARTLKSNVRAGQDLVSRYGGEEFIIVLTNSNHSAALVTAEKIRNAISALPPIAQTDGIELSVTIGMALLEPPFARQNTIDGRLQLLDELIRQADGALYRGKAGGRDQVVVGR